MQIGLGFVSWRIARLLPLLTAGAIAAPTSTQAQTAPAQNQSPPQGQAPAQSRGLAPGEVPAQASSADPADADPTVRVTSPRTESPRLNTPGPAPASGTDYATQRFEFAGAPLIGGNSDIGFEFGAVGTMTHFSDGIRPYHWNSDLVLAASVKGGPGGAELAQQNYVLQVDMPESFRRELRLTMTASFQRTVDMGYYGVGNSRSSDLPPELAGAPARFFEFLQREAVLRALARYALQEPYHALIELALRYVSPEAYGDSQLARDVASGSVRGLQGMGLGFVAFGAGVDTRDDEVFPHRGVFHQVGIKLSGALPTDSSIRYAAVGGVFSGFVPIGPLFVLAARGVIDAEAGHVPFYDLFTGGIFHTDEMPGGPKAVRGVPIGRYLGLLKVIANLELRALLVRFMLLGGKFHFGGDIFSDAGRVWSDYTFSSARDGKGTGLKWGVGGGLYLRWGQAAIFRVDVAFSPDAVTASPNFPLGLYVSEGVMF